METNLKKAIYAILTLVLMASAGSAAKVALVVDFPDNTTYTGCLTVENGSSGFDVLNAAPVSPTWGGPHPIYGHSLCKINGFGTEANAGGCEWGAESWAYWAIKSGGSSWTSIPVGHDGGEDCWNRDPSSWDGHYCAVDGDVVGYVFGAYDPITYAAPAMRSHPTFSSVCAAEGGSGRHAFVPKVLGMAVYPQVPSPDAPIILQLKDNKTGRPVKGADIEVYDEVAGVTRPLAAFVSNRSGEAVFSISRPGEYLVSITGTAYPHRYVKISVEETTTTTTTSTTTTTASTSTTASLPGHFLGGGETPTTTLTLPPPEVTGMAAAQEPETGKDTPEGSPTLPNAAALLAGCVILASAAYARKK
jgi:hypothetical protein